MPAITSLIHRFRRLQATRLAASNAVELDLNRQVVNASTDLIMRCGWDMRTQFVSPSSLEMLGYSPEEMIGKGPEGLVYPEDMPIIIAHAQTLQAGGDRESGVTNRMVRKDGGIIWVETRTRMVFDPLTNQPTGVMLMVRDITIRKNLQDQLQHLALTDSLTGLANRRAFDEGLNRDWTRSLREEKYISLLLIDVDQFKRFNDQYGHQVGDDCIRAVAGAVSRSMRRPGDLGARYGGDELAIILPETDAVGAAAVANTVLRQVQELRLPHEGNLVGGGGFVSTSIGAATILCIAGSTTQTSQSLLAAADQALYVAKQNGRNQVAANVLNSPAATAPRVVAR